MFLDHRFLGHHFDMMIKNVGMSPDTPIFLSTVSLQAYSHPCEEACWEKRQPLSKLTPAM